MAYQEPERLSSPLSLSSSSKAIASNKNALLFHITTATSVTIRTRRPHFCHGQYLNYAGKQNLYPICCTKCLDKAGNQASPNFYWPLKRHFINSTSRM